MRLYDMIILVVLCCMITVGCSRNLGTVTGPKGDKGNVGAKGDTGAVGNTGATGAQGIQGPQGSIGLTGATGDVGAAGANGLNGTNGINGVGVGFVVTTATTDVCPTGGSVVGMFNDVNGNGVYDVGVDTNFTTFTLCSIPAESMTYLCHIPPGNPSNSRVLYVPASALAAHLGHGDTLGECQ